MKCAGGRRARSPRRGSRGDRAGPTATTSCAAAKAAAVVELKSARARGDRERIAAAEQTYRTALAELQEFETGERPTWAPRPEPDDAEPD